ncbi:MAG: hypothetical protein J3Q66DRAFT_329034 [Benniella sp.]|nr:MAG: hypothetical protein J3Q66DRAFT_329034 [Benniella sp.]
MASSSTTSTYEQDQELFTDTLLKLQIHSALVKENVQNNKSPRPLLAQSCALLDNLPARSPHWTPAQQNLIRSLKMDAWSAFADECIKAGDLIQAEDSLQKLSVLQDTASGPLSLRSKAMKQQQRDKRASQTSDTTSTSMASHGGAGSSSASPTASPSSSVAIEITKEQCQAAAALIQTWDKLRQVYNDKGQKEMSNNFAKRIAKMKERLDSLQIEPE